MSTSLTSSPCAHRDLHSFPTRRSSDLVAAPYFVVYQLEEVGIGYLTYTVIALAGSTTGFFTSAWWGRTGDVYGNQAVLRWTRSEEHTSELQSQSNLVCRLLLEKKKTDY